jgi:hypothetical protein
MLPGNVLTDQNGEFRFPHLDPGNYAVFAEDRESGYGFGANLGTDDLHRGVAAEITPDHPAVELRVVLPPKAGFLQVRLTDKSTGNVIPGVTLKVALAENDKKWFMAAYSWLVCPVMGHNGCGVLIPPDQQVIVQVSSPGPELWHEIEGARTERSLRVASGDRVTWDVQLESDLKWPAVAQPKLLQPNPSK